MSSQSSDKRGQTEGHVLFGKQIVKLWRQRCTSGPDKGGLPCKTWPTRSGQEQQQQQPRGMTKQKSQEYLENGVKSAAVVATGFCRLLPSPSTHTLSLSPTHTLPSTWVMWHSVVPTNTLLCAAVVDNQRSLEVHFFRTTLPPPSFVCSCRPFPWRLWRHHVDLSLSSSFSFRWRKENAQGLKIKFRLWYLSFHFL